MSITGQFRLLTFRVFFLGFVLAELTACSDSSSSHSFSPLKNAKEVWVAATGPLEDLNLRREEIPPLLQESMRDPYALPATLECKPMREEVAQLDLLLGEDMKQSADVTTFVSYEEGHEDSYVPQLPKRPEIPDTEILVDKGIDAAHDRALGFIHDQTNILPFRHIIRTITGAEQHDRKVQRAKVAGQMRRAFLKGLATAKFGRSCMFPLPVIEAHASIQPAPAP